MLFWKLFMHAFYLWIRIGLELNFVSVAGILVIVGTSVKK